MVGVGLWATAAYGQAAKSGAEIVEDLAIDMAIEGLLDSPKKETAKPVEKPAEPAPAEKPAEKPAEAPPAAEPARAAPEASDDLDKAIEEASKVPMEAPPSVKKEEPVPVPPPAPVAAAEPAPLAGEAAPADFERAAVKAMDPRSAEIDLMKDSEELRRRAYERHGREALVEANKAFQARKFTESTKLFKDAVDAFKDAGFRAENEADRKTAEKGMMESTYMEAFRLMEQADYEDAKKLCRRALLIGHPLAGDLAAEIARREAKPPPPPPKPTQRWQQKDLTEAEEKLSDLLRQGREHYLAGELDKAQEFFEKIVKLDPYNTEAIRMMEKVANRKGDIAIMELEYTRKQMMTDVQRDWNRRDYALMESEMSAPVTDRQQPISTEDPRRKAIMDKMEKIEIPDIDFRQANIQDVIQFLQSSSVEHDPLSSESKEKRGVNMILNLGLVGAAGGGLTAPVWAAQQDPFAAEAVPEAAMAAGGVEVPLLTFSARYITVLEALKIVTSIANLKWRIEGSVVMIVPFNAPDGPIIHRMYDVLASFVEVTERTREELSATARKSDFTALERTTTTRETNLKDLFGEMGVQWPGGSFIKHVPAIGKLMVANTENNLAIFEEKLAALNVVPSQIEIEARFVEVGQTDLNSFGIEWGLTDNWEMAYKSGAVGPPSSRPRLIMGRNMGGLDRGFTRGERFVRDMAVPTGATVQPDDVLTLAAVLTNPEISMVLHAIEQKGNADLLSAPKVTTKSGLEATIKVVTEYIYPTEFTVQPILAAAAGGTLVAIGGIVEPGSFETREVGVILSVLPEVSPEGQMINLTMTPEVVSEPIWHNYGSVFKDQWGNEQVLNMEQPFFHTRTVTTQISIYNGATVVMGGMITEIRSSVDDKIPVLGDIPLLGRLFRSRYDKADKRNLLIFVTARLVDPAGKPIMKRAPLVSKAAPDAAAAARP
ncbi:MAG: hypothetical protein QME60_00090 [Verrucomicrobiota bacterium]|nr:hypothetical protein [Verrucomicrobiota bacterium]